MSLSSQISRPHDFDSQKANRNNATATYCSHVSRASVSFYVESKTWCEGRQRSNDLYGSVKVHLEEEIAASCPCSIALWTSLFDMDTFSSSLKLPSISELSASSSILGLSSFGAGRVFGTIHPVNKFSNPGGRCARISIPGSFQSTIFSFSMDW